MYKIYYHLFSYLWKGYFIIIELEQKRSEVYYAENKIQKQSKKLLWKNISIKKVHIVSAEKKCNNLFFLELHRRKSILNKRTNYTIFSMLYETYKLKVS